MVHPIACEAHTSVLSRHLRMRGVARRHTRLLLTRLQLMLAGGSVRQTVTQQREAVFVVFNQERPSCLGSRRKTRLDR